MKTKREILAAQIAVKRTLKNEQGLERELSRFFKRLQKEVIQALHEYWSEYHLLQGQVNLMVAPVHEAHREYYEILEKYVRREYKLGQAEAKRNVARLERKNRMALKSATVMPIKGFINYNKDNGLFATDPKAERDLLNRTFRASEQTMSRVDNQINAIITDGYRSGKGINDIAASLNKRFDQLSSWESRRIARTEVNTSHNTATYDTYQELGVEYTQWIAANDDRTRDSHAEIDGEIIPIGAKYSNGLAYPGDMTGDISEWINCRCSNAPFVIPYGYMAPSFSPFREEDLVPIESKSFEDLIQPPQPVEEFNTMLQGDPTIEKQGNGTLYTYENGFELYVSDKSIISHEELVTHINSLPEPLRNMDVLKRIDFTPDVVMKGKSGEYVPQFQKLYVYHSGSKQRTFEVLNHELGHAFDNQVYVNNHKNWRGWGLSNVDVYEKIFKADNKLKEYVRPNGKKRIPNRLVTDYAGRSWKKYKKKFSEHMKIWKRGSQNPEHKPHDMRYMEDFAESTQLYLSPATHDQFVKDYPNRAKYLESIYGKIKFDKNSPYYKALQQDGLI